MTRRAFACLVLLAAASAACPALAANGPSGDHPVIEGTVIWVYEGNRVNVLMPDGTQQEILLYGILSPVVANGPKAGQAYSQESRAELALRAMNKKVQIELVRKDGYDRLLGIIWYEGRCINMEMVLNGAAWADRSPVDQLYVPEFTEGENRARKAKAGLFKNPAAVPPWEFKAPKRIPAR